MFLSDTHLPQVLTAEDYTSPERLARETALLLMPAWHCIGTLSEMPNDGDFLTTEILGYPLIAWRTGETVQVFLNVCPHRFSRLTGAACGSSPERLQCQYHGWEFDCDGNTRKIPDARSFRPLSKGALSLRKFRTRLCGQLIFVCLSDDAPDLEEFLGPGFAIGQALCSADRKLSWAADYEFDANWKCKCENSLESYHVDMVHPQTFVRSPEPEEVRHEMHDGWSLYATTQAAPKAIDRFMDRLIHRLVDADMEPEYEHYHFYPHIMFGKMRLFSWMECQLPVSPTRTRVIGRFFYHTGRSTGLRSKIFGRGLGRWERKFFEQLSVEDTGVLEEVQRGLGSPRQPSKGVVSIREERCFHFQDYIRRMTKRDEVATPAPEGELVASRSSELD